MNVISSQVFGNSRAKTTAILIAIGSKSMLVITTQCYFIRKYEMVTK
jgi:hypothetical protein